MKYKCDNHFFSHPNILNSYYAGWLAADGYIVKNSNCATYSKLGVEISTKDIKLLECFKKDIKFEGPIRTRYRTLNNKIFSMSSIGISSIQLCQDLYNNFNITPRKSLTLKPPINLNLNCALSYIKGYIDGDGSVMLHKRQDGKIGYRLKIEICGTYEIAYWIKELINQICDQQIDNKIQIRKNIYMYSFGGDNAYYVGKKLQEIKTPSLERKWSNISHWEKIKNEYNTRLSK